MRLTISDADLRALINQDPSIALIIKKEHITDSIWKEALSLEPALFPYIDSPSEELCISACKEDGRNILHIISNKDLHLTKRMIIEAVKNYPSIILEIDKVYQTDEIKEFAFDLEPTLIKKFIYVRPEYINYKLAKDPTFARYINATEDQIITALNDDINFCAYIETYTPKIKDFIKHKYPDIIHLIPQLRNEVI